MRLVQYSVARVDVPGISLSLPRSSSYTQRLAQNALCTPSNVIPFAVPVDFPSLKGRFNYRRELEKHFPYVDAFRLDFASHIMSALFAASRRTAQPAASRSLSKTVPAIGGPIGRKKRRNRLSRWSGFSCLAPGILSSSLAACRTFVWRPVTSRTSCG